MIAAKKRPMTTTLRHLATLAAAHLTPDQLAQFINDEIARWAKVINTVGVKAEQ